MKQTLSSIGQIAKKVLKWFGKAWLIVSSIIGSIVLGAILLIIVAAATGGSEEGTVLQRPTVGRKEIRSGGKDLIAVVDLTGPIVEQVDDSDPLAFSPHIVSSRRVNQIFDHLINDNEVKAVVLRMNTPGGTVVASDDIYRKVRELRERKPVVVSMGDVSASGGYYIAAGASKIVANRASVTGSIGVIAQLPNVSGLYDKLGVDMRVIKSGEYKDMGSASREMTAEERAIIESIIKDNYDQFVTAIAEGRGMDEATVRRLGDGRIYSGKQAEEVGLVDSLGNFDTAIEAAEELANISNATVVEYSNQSFFESLFQARGGISPFKSLNQIAAPKQFRLYYMMDL